MYVAMLLTDWYVALPSSSSPRSSPTKPPPNCAIHVRMQERRQVGLESQSRPGRVYRPIRSRDVDADCVKLDLHGALHVEPLGSSPHARQVSLPCLLEFLVGCAEGGWLGLAITRW